MDGTGFMHIRPAWLCACSRVRAPTSRGHFLQFLFIAPKYLILLHPSLDPDASSMWVICHGDILRVWKEIGAAIARQHLTSCDELAKACWSCCILHEC